MSNKAIQNLRNYYYPGTPVITPARMEVEQKKKGSAPLFSISPVQFERIRQDIRSWREAIIEAEQAWYPHRVKMQRIFMDTVLNEHVDACINKRKNLTLLRKFKLCDDKGKEDETTTKLFQKTWFSLFQSYALDALYYGYNLIQLGDVENDAYPNICFVKRHNISPDRRVVNNYVYSLSGAKWDDAPYKDWYIYISTPSETGVSPCGNGILYKIAKTEIFLRNNTGQNADYNEMFGQPIRKGTTTKADEERRKFEEALRGMGSSAYILLDEGQDTLELVMDSARGAAHKTYQDFEDRGEKKISKVILGHADALDSTPGKLGGDQGGEKSPTAKALQEVQTRDAEFLQPIINEQLIPRMRLHGFNIPEGLHFEYKNDDEKEEFRAREDESNKKTAELFQTIKNAGGEITEKAWKYFEERTGIPGIEKHEEPEPMPPIGGAPGMNGAPKPGAPQLTPNFKKNKEILNKLIGEYLQFEEENNHTEASEVKKKFFY